MKKFQEQKSNKKILLVVSGLVLLVLVIFASKLFRRSTTDGQGSTSSSVRSQEINKEFTFPIGSSKEDDANKINFVVEKIEENKEIVVKGQKATAVAGRIFLIVNLKITNRIDKPIEMDTRDYVRLVVNGNEKEMLAPDIHNDPVEIQAISTKYTRVAFPVNSSDSNFELQIGEIKGDKEKIKLDLK